MRYRSVMVAFDGSPEAELALAHACAIAQACLARVTLVGVLAPPPLLAWQTPGRARARCRAPTCRSGCRPPPTTCPTTCGATTLLLEGDPARELLHAAREHDVLFMGAGPASPTTWCARPTCP